MIFRSCRRGRPAGVRCGPVSIRLSGAADCGGGFTKASAEKAIRSGAADAIAYGRAFIASPDLPGRFAVDAPLNPYDRATFYGGGMHGYTDYPNLWDAGAAARPQSALSVAET